MEIVHVPVMLNEIVEALRVKRSGIYVDGTVGLGGHAEGILRKAEGECTLIGMDRDEEALEIAGKRLKDYDVQLMKDNFSNMEDAVKGLGYKEVDGILLDLGLSTLQLKAEGRGFSFLRDDPLDMRMDTAQELTAANIVNEYPEKDLANVLWKYGEERFSRKIARAIVNARQRKTIKTCKELALIIEKAVKRRGRIHPATRAFQTLRIEVNKELTLLSMALDAGINLLGPKGRLCVLSYHSLEDRIVKHSFKDMAKKGVLTIITKRPLTPQKEERDANPSSRSAKLRVAEKL
ncbi:MAG TPA: 16S rRNA (cytosine(1402)-N(4))-methyltransferase RsmH [Nitrospirae bacterium]|nr:ribosomal RNA small subunit methyltransferase H [bacterium BMS3Abin10]GBE40017.1 ribosomal RNA small subunit methyltransferase H [bacterium BMS3Bbin08]HDH51774.1 16S rRNA (cytosine(1402)-N(4))-methyltransferase RsmH [Nitrospirota bacterium]HDK81366.1 16S rRNA (cytosine(1402)-N(4))-methyltransferase RsmH [Nitrospirota bacterium]HDO25227.1 16S rRNA (cytosine(1402)-N(4))-methyltransferase RsmH [Nitrospirota bacterium]